MLLKPLLPKSYRPIALLPILSKVLEKIVFTQLAKFLEENNLIHPNLHGSRPGHNTATALVQLYDRWAEEIDDGKMVGVLVCDQSAAFDVCDHYLLVEKLKLMGLEEKPQTGSGAICQVGDKAALWMDIFPPHLISYPVVCPKEALEDLSCGCASLVTNQM